MRSAHRSRIGILAVVLTLVASVGVVIALEGSAALAASTFVVNTTTDSHDAALGDGICADGTRKCSLRAAVEEANSNAGADTIKVPAGIYTFTITDHLSILDDVSVAGAGSTLTTVDAASLARVFTIGSSGYLPNVTLAGLTLTGGNAWGGAIYVDAGVLSVDGLMITGNLGIGGGGIYVGNATVTITDSTIRSNRATDGAGIMNYGRTTITGSTISSNTATAASVFTHGGGIFNAGTLSLTNSTVSANSADRGGGIINNSGAALTLLHTTVANNQATGTLTGSGIQNDGASMTLTASILDGNMSPATRTDCISSVVPTSGGYNFIGDGTGCMWPNATSDIVGTAALPLSVGLGPLQDNGGPTMTHALLTGSQLAINTIPAASCAVATDQRGVARPQGDMCDKGAFEVKAPIAVDDTYATAMNSPLLIPAPGVLGNDIEGEGGSLSVWFSKGTSFPMPTSHGAVTYRLDGSFDYTPNAGFQGVDSFTYTVRDSTAVSPGVGWNVDSATVRITVGNPAVATVGLVDPSTGVWRLRNTAGVVSEFYYGNPGDYPFVGDWDCDGEDTPGLYRQSDGFAYLRNSNTQGVADLTFFFGNPGDVPIAGDFNANGCDTLSIYRPSEARFYIINALGQDGGGLGAADYSFLFGDAGDKPVVGDWDRDGIDEIGLHRESTGFFYYRDTLSTGIADGQFYFGDPGDRFVAGDWGIVDGVDTPGLFRPSNQVFYFRHDLTQGNADSQFTWTGAGSGWLPVAGDFNLG